MTQTSYVNPNGLPADAQITSARDLAILARAAIRELPEYGLYWHISAIKFGRRVIRNYNTLIDRYPGADGMKTGFICASGFNLVATATRGSRRLIAVVLGAHSGMQRAEKAAQLLERGFTGVSGLSWLTASFGTVDKLATIDAPPVDLTNEICNRRGRHRRAPPSDSEESNAMGGEPGSPLAMMTGFQLGPPKQGLIGPLQPSMEPLVVYTGPARSPDQIEVAAEPVKKRPRRAVARAPAEDAPAANAAPAAAKPAAAKPVAASPVAASPVAAKPVAPKPVAAKPVAARPAPPKPAAPKQAAAKPERQDGAKPMPLNAAVKPAAARSAALPEGAAKPKPKPKPKPAATEQQ
jgi:D-alanyl-D-alanine carboxypeptidase